MTQFKGLTRFVIKEYEGETYKVETLPTEESCYFHAVLYAFNKAYQNNSSTEFRTKLSREFRELLAERLDSSNFDGELIYDTLSEGTLRSFSNSIPKYKRKNLIKLLRQNKSVDHSYHELVCDYIEKDIYIISEDTRELYRLSNEKIYIKNRPSIFILYLEGDPGHYSLLVEKINGRYISCFDVKDKITQHHRKKLGI